MPDLDFGFLLSDVLSVFTAIAAVGVVYLCGALAAVRRFRGLPERSAGHSDPVTVLRPLHGFEPGLAGRLSRLCDQNYGGSLQVVFGCQAERDAAIPFVADLRRSRGAADVDLVVDDRVWGTNRKVSNLMNMFAAAKHDILIASDSDIEVDRCYVARIAGALATENVGAVTCLYHGIPGAAAAAKLSALTINAHFLPMAVLATTFGLARPCFGATIATTRFILEKIGGFAVFADKLADDYAFGAAVRSAGYEIAIPNFTVGHACNEATIGCFMRQSIRNARTIKTIDPWGHAGSLICNPFPLALIGSARGGAAALAVAALALVLQIALCRCAERKFILPRQNLFLIPIADVLALFVYVASFFGSTVTWRGRRYRVVAGGFLSADPR